MHLDRISSFIISPQPSGGRRWGDLKHEPVHFEPQEQGSKSIGKRSTTSSCHIYSILYSLPALNLLEMLRSSNKHSGHEQHVETPTKTTALSSPNSRVKPPSHRPMTGVEFLKPSNPRFVERQYPCLDIWSQLAIKTN